jgi:hypothetical protein
MKRTTMLLTGLVLLLVLVGWYLLIFSPRSDELAEVEAQIVDVQAQQQTTTTRIVELQGVREEAPQLQAELAAAESLLPRDTALPSALRQLQQAADASGATLVSVAPARPAAVEGATAGLFAMPLNAEVRGTYFQIVDVLRRLEDPAISPRGLVWDSAAMTLDETRPDLIVVLSGRMFAVLPAPPAPDTGTSEPVDEDAEATDADDDADVEVDVEVTTEDDQ